MRDQIKVALKIARRQALLENLIAYQLGLSPPHYPMPVTLDHAVWSCVHQNVWWHSVALAKRDLHA